MGTGKENEAIGKDEIPLEDPANIRVSGTATGADKSVKCTLTGPTRTMTRFAKITAGNWNVVFDMIENGTHSLFCHADLSGDKDIIIVITGLPDPAGVQPAGALHKCLALNPGSPMGNSLSASASGTVLNAVDTVSCTLTPIKDDGTPRGDTQTQNAVMCGTSWTVTFVPTPTNPPTNYSGL